LFLMIFQQKLLKFHSSLFRILQERNTVLNYKFDSDVNCQGGMVKRYIEIFLLYFLGVACSFCASDNEKINEIKENYHKLIELNESFVQQIVNVKERKDAQIIIERFIAERDKLVSRINDVENKYPDFRQDPALREFENTLERKTNETVDSGIAALRKFLPVKNLKELVDAMKNTIPK